MCAFFTIPEIEESERYVACEQEKLCRTTSEGGLSPKTKSIAEDVCKRPRSMVVDLIKSGWQSHESEPGQEYTFELDMDRERLLFQSHLSAPVENPAEKLTTLQSPSSQRSTPISSPIAHFPTLPDRSSRNGALLPVSVQHRSQRHASNCSNSESPLTARERLCDDVELASRRSGDECQTPPSRIASFTKASHVHGHAELYTIHTARRVTFNPAPEKSGSVHWTPRSGGSVPDFPGYNRCQSSSASQLLDCMLSDEQSNHQYRVPQKLQEDLAVSPSTSKVLDKSPSSPLHPIFGRDKDKVSGDYPSDDERMRPQYDSSFLKIPPSIFPHTPAAAPFPCATQEASQTPRRFVSREVVRKRRSSIHLGPSSFTIRKSRYVGPRGCSALRVDHARTTRGKFWAPINPVYVPCEGGETMRYEETSRGLGCRNKKDEQQLPYPGQQSLTNNVGQVHTPTSSISFSSSHELDSPVNAVLSQETEAVNEQDNSTGWMIYDVPFSAIATGEKRSKRNEELMQAGKDGREVAQIKAVDKPPRLTNPSRKAEPPSKPAPNMPLPPVPPLNKSKLPKATIETKNPMGPMKSRRSRVESENSFSTHKNVSNQLCGSKVRCSSCYLRRPLSQSSRDSSTQASTPCSCCSPPIDSSDAFSSSSCSCSESDSESMSSGHTWKGPYDQSYQHQRPQRPSLTITENGGLYETTFELIDPDPTPKAHFFQIRGKSRLPTTPPSLSPLTFSSPFAVKFESAGDWEASTCTCSQADSHRCSCRSSMSDLDKVVPNTGGPKVLRFDVDDLVHGIASAAKASSTLWPRTSPTSIRRSNPITPTATNLSSPFFSTTSDFNPREDNYGKSPEPLCYEAVHGRRGQWSIYEPQQFPKEGITQEDKTQTGKNDYSDCNRAMADSQESFPKRALKSDTLLRSNRETAAFLNSTPKREEGQSKRQERSRSQRLPGYQREHLIPLATGPFTDPPKGMMSTMPMIPMTHTSTLLYNDGPGLSSTNTSITGNRSATASSGTTSHPCARATIAMVDRQYNQPPLTPRTLNARVRREEIRRRRNGQRLAALEKLEGKQRGTGSKWFGVIAGREQRARLGKKTILPGVLFTEEEEEGQQHWKAEQRETNLAHDRVEARLPLRAPPPTYGFDCNFIPLHSFRDEKRELVKHQVKALGHARLAREYAREKYIDQW